MKIDYFFKLFILWSYKRDKGRLLIIQVDSYTVDQASLYAEDIDVLANAVEVLVGNADDFTEHLVVSDVSEGFKCEAFLISIF